MNTLLQTLKTKYDVLEIVELGTWTYQNYEIKQAWLEDTLKRLRKDEFAPTERIVFVYDSDLKISNQVLGSVLKNLQVLLNKIDIGNSFVILMTSKEITDLERQELKKLSSDAESIEIVIDNTKTFSMDIVDKLPSSRFEVYQYGSLTPNKISLNDLTDRQRYLLTESKTFCMYPWIHLHVWPTGEAYPCCHSQSQGKLGDTKQQTLQEIWNSEPMKKMRLGMLNEETNPACARCYEQEASGFFSGRRSANKHHGHHIRKLTDNPFELTYWDIRFSNLCNLSCRTCGHIFSSSWHQDQKKVVLKRHWDDVRGPDWPTEPPYTMEQYDALPDWIKHEIINDFNGELLTHLKTVEKLPVLYYAGKTELDMWEQLLPHIDYVEQIYFAGGEPLMMEEHYRILDELERRGRFDVKLVYNTNFTQTRLKNRSVFDYWSKFDSVAVGASLDAMGSRAEYIRNGTRWDRVIQNREQMLKICPQVDFYISPTVSIMNVLHLPDFHREWVDRGFLRPQDLNVNILQDPKYYRIDIATSEFKQKVAEKYHEHLAWLKPLDQLNRATVGFESAMQFMMATDNSNLLDTFWTRTRQLDQIRGQNVMEALPELAMLS